MNATHVISNEPKKEPKRLLRIWTVDDNTALRETIFRLLNMQPGISCRRQFDSADAVLAALAEERPPDLILLDVNLGQSCGLDAIQPILKLAPSTKVVMLTMFSNSHHEAKAHLAGAAGFLLKSYEFEELVSLIHEAHRNPGSEGLFPNLALAKRILAAEQTAATTAKKSGFGLLRAFRAFCGLSPDRQPIR